MRKPKKVEVSEEVYAKAVKSLFDAFLRVGFTTEQAFELTKTIVSKSAGET